MRISGLVLIFLFFVSGNILLNAGNEKAAAEKEWTFMVFLNADNNLDYFGVDDLHEMEAVGSTNEINILVELDREEGPSKRYFVKKGHSDIIVNLGEVDMGDYKHLVDFVKWGVNNYPAKKYCVVIWNHGSGWNKKGPKLGLRGISYDDSSNNHITTNQLAIACAQIKNLLGRNLDIMGFDACLMGMAEVNYAIKDSIDVVVSSEETEPGDGWPYDGLLAPLKNNPGMNPHQFASNMVKKYAASYNGGSQGSSSTTQSAIDLTKYNLFMEKLNQFCESQMGTYAGEIGTVLQNVQKFYYSSNIDLIHFLKLLKSNLVQRDEIAASKIQALIDCSKDIVICNATTGIRMKNASGIAIYFPRGSYSWSSNYASLAWANKGLWDEFCQAYYQQVQNREIINAIRAGDTTLLVKFMKSAGKSEIKVLKQALNTEIYVNKSITDSKVISEVSQLTSN
ncbi:clostripain-related cysteine peptidase [Candidatus Riflebacteria bacterium]